MEQDNIRDRLIQAIDHDPRSDRQLSIDANLGVNYVNQLKKGDKNPKPSQIDALCRALNVSPMYIFIGVDLDQDAEEILRLYVNASPDLKKAFRQILESHHKVD